MANELKKNSVLKIIICFDTNLEGEGEGGVSLVTIIAISRQLRRSSDGFDFESDTVQNDS
jgi:hypothetical protein